MDYSKLDSVKNKKAALLFALGILFILFASAYSYVKQGVDVTSVVMVLVGASLLFLCLCYRRKSEQPFNHILPWGRVSLFLLVAILSIIFLFVANYLAARVTTRWDMTQYNQHTLSQSTIDFVSAVDQPVELTAFYVGLPPKYLEDLLKEYSRVSKGHIKTIIVDPIEDIAYAAKFGNVISGQESKLIVTSGVERNDVDFSDSYLSEEQVTNAITRVARELRQVYFLTGHGELSIENENNQGLSKFSALLNANNINTKDLMLGTQGVIPDDCDVLIIAGPHNDLTDEENALINVYLQEGGDALFLIQDVVLTSPDVTLTDEQKNKNPSMNRLLNLWGVHVGDDIIVDLSSHIGGDVGSPATKNYAAHKAITEGLDYTFYVRPRSISRLQQRRATLKSAPIVQTASTEKSWAETDRALNVRYDEGVDIPGPVPFSSVIWEGKEPGEESDTRIIVFTDADFLSNAYLNRYSNAQMGANVVNWLSELDYTVLLEQKDIKVERLEITSEQRRMITALLFLMPLLIGLVGVFIRIRS